MHRTGIIKPTSQEYFIRNGAREVQVKTVGDLGVLGVPKAVVNVFLMLFWIVVIRYHITIYYLFIASIVICKFNIFVTQLVGWYQEDIFFGCFFFSLF